MKNAAAFAALLASASALPHVKRQSYGNGTAPMQNSGEWSTIRSNIKHVVYLMLENHSFDNIAGYWDFNPDIDNLKNLATPYCNNYTNANWTVWGEPLAICAGPYEDEVPLTDPDHNFAGTSYEIYQNWEPSLNDTPTMGGFIERQSDKYSATPGDTSFVIKAYNQEKTQTLATLAQNYAFFDSYHAEHPCVNYSELPRYIC